jgi:hypothetical protein
VVPWGELFGLVGHCHFGAWLLGCLESLHAVLERCYCCAICLQQLAFWWVGIEAGVCLVVSSISQPHVSTPFLFLVDFILRGISVSSICGTFFGIFIPSAGVCASCISSSRIIFAFSKKNRN